MSTFCAEHFSGGPLCGAARHCSFHSGTLSTNFSWSILRATMAAHWPFDVWPVSEKKPQRSWSSSAAPASSAVRSDDCLASHVSSSPSTTSEHHFAQSPIFWPFGPYSIGRFVAPSSCFWTLSE